MGMEKQEDSGQKTASGAGITAGVIVLFLFLRILAVSDWNWQVAAEIADSFNFDDAISIAFGTLFERPDLTGIVITIVLPLVLFRLFILARYHGSRGSLTDWLLAVSLVATQVVLVRSFSLWWPVIAPVVLAIGLVIVYMLLKKRDTPPWFTQLGKRAGAIMVAALLVLATTVNTPWSPEEIIVTKSGQLQGYVLENTSGYLRVLTTDREVVIFTNADVISRTPADK